MQFFMNDLRGELMTDVFFINLIFLVGRGLTAFAFIMGVSYK